MDTNFFYLLQSNTTVVLNVNNLDTGLYMLYLTSLSCTDLVPGDFIHVFGDAHVYSTHVRPLEDQLQKLPKPFPILKINPLKKDIDSFEAADFELIGYDPHQKIEMKMAV
ncbi:hypothetical protein LguiA_008973 [Lonicera macranthoides]